MLGRDIECFANEAGIGFHLAGNQRLCQHVGFERGDYRVRFVAPVAVEAAEPPGDGPGSLSATAFETRNDVYEGEGLLFAIRAKQRGKSDRPSSDPRIEI